MALKTPSITMYPTTAASAVEPSALLAQPMAMPTAKMSGSQVKTALPAAEMTAAPPSKPGIAQQDAGCGEDCDGKHQAAAQPLEGGEGLVWLLLWSQGGGLGC
jgi:hypothetical protein